MYGHILIVGGTGMLKKTSIALAGMCKTLTSVARTRESLAVLNEALAGTGLVHHMLMLDWTTPATFLASLSDHVNRVGEPSLVLAWIHDQELGPRIASAVCPSKGRCDYYQVRGSAAGDPVAPIVPNKKPATLQTGMCFHEIILGFHIDAKGSRWLHDHEICAGVTAAIQRGDQRAIVGTVVPWSARPH